MLLATSATGHFVDAEGGDVEASELAVDGKIEKREVPLLGKTAV